MKSAASICGISLRVVQAAKAGGCPAVKPSGRTDCDQLLAWLAEHPETLKLAGQALSRDEEIILKIRAERQLKEHQLAERLKQFVPMVDGQKVIGDMIARAKKVLLSGPASLAPQVVGVPIPEAEKLLREWLHEALTHLHNDPTGEAEAATTASTPDASSL
jgi:hypothetical protein